MESEAQKPVSERLFSSSGWSFLLTLVFASLIYLPFLGSRPLLGSDEPRVAGIAVEMSRYGDWVEPALNGKPFLEIPPMHWWISAATFKVLGEGTASAKLPSAMAAIAAVLCVFWLARFAGLSNFASFICAMMLATAPEFWIIGRRCIMDMTMCAFVALAFLSFLAFANSEGNGWRRWLWLGGFWLGLSGALLSKGIIGFGIPCAGIFFWLLFRKCRSFVVWGGLFGAAAFAMLPLCAWLLELYSADGLHAVKTLAWTNNIGRFLGSQNEHVEPVYYYFAKFPAQFLPWTVLFAISAYLLFSGRLKAEHKDGALFGAFCLAVPFLVLCCAAGKRSIYLLPLYPVAALFSAFAVDWLLERVRLNWRPQIKEGLIVFFLIYAVSLVVADAFIHHSAFKQNSYEPIFAKCSQMIDSGRRMVIHSEQERILGASVFFLGRRFQASSDPEVTKDILSSDPKAFAIADDGAFEALGGGVRLIEKFKIGKDSYMAIFDMEPAKNK